MTQRIAIYDMDRTITRRGTFTPFLIHAAKARAPWRLLLTPFVLVAMASYALRLIDRGRLKEIVQALLLGPHVAPAELGPITASFAAKTMATNIYPKALERIAKDRAAGCRLVLATASYRLYVEAIAARLGFDDVIATGSLIGLDARIHAKIDGENAFGPAKLRMIEAWLEGQGIARGGAFIRFYSDHVSDWPALEWADEAFATTPSPALRAMALRRGWPILDWN